MSRFGTLSDLKKREGSPRSDYDSDEEGKPTSYYTGGSSSGLSVVDPRGGKAAIDRIMAKQGVEGVAKGTLTIRFYKNGYVVEDGDLQSYDSEEGRAFIADVENGVIPRSLHAILKSRGGEIDVSVEDHKTEDYVPPPYRAFAGSGATLGHTSASNSAAIGGFSSPVIVDSSAPTTVIQVRLANGKREKVTINLTNTVADLLSLVTDLRGVPQGSAFTLSAGFPPKPLTDATATIEEAGLRNASVTQALV